MNQDIESVTVLGDRLEYAWVGERTAAPAIVMLHDSLGSVRTWKDFPAQLDKTR